MRRIISLLEFESLPYTQHERDLALITGRYFSKFKEIRAMVGNSSNNSFAASLTNLSELIQEDGSPFNFTFLNSASSKAASNSESKPPVLPSPQTPPTFSAPGSSGGGPTLFGSTNNAGVPTASQQTNLFASTGNGVNGFNTQTSTQTPFGVPSAGVPTGQNPSNNTGFGGTNAFAPFGSTAPVAPSFSSKGFGKFGTQSTPIFPATNASVPSASQAQDASTGTNVKVSSHANDSAGTAKDSASDETTTAEVLAGLTRLGYTNVTREDLGKLCPPDEYEKEIMLMAEVRAYFHISYKVRPYSFYFSCNITISDFISYSVFVEDHRQRPDVN